MSVEFGQNVKSIAQAENRKENGPAGIGPEVSSLAKAKNESKTQLNSAILESAININAASGSPQALVLKTALEGINDALQATMGGNAIQNTYDSGLDVSPEATAERIVSLSTAFFSSYQEQHPELSQEEAVTNFTALISGGIDTGFSEAREILGGLNVLEGDIATNIDLTYDLVQEKLNAFLENFNHVPDEVDEKS